MLTTEDITYIDKAEAREGVMPKAGTRREIILNLITDSGNEGMTVTELAERLYQLGYTPYWDRNFAAPRVTELAQLGLIEAIGRKEGRSGYKEAIWRKKV